MKHIVKQDEPEAFIRWKAPAGPDWQPSYGVLGGKPKQAVKKALMVEQGYICCYCERRLTDDDAHIEHFRPQSDPAIDPLDFGNLLCSCQNRLKKGEPRHCGHRKGDWFDDTLLISPLDPGCERRFKFTYDGEIKSAADPDAAAFKTIEKLGLNIPKLKSQRVEALEPFLEENLSLEEVRTFVSGYLEKDSSGRFGEFWSMIQCLSVILPSFK
uniref:TIGR02646 family protein n=1 Tax=Candidatus Kentrum sp. TUN TaxID=2126343 RepID=A0A451AIW4_9GAMM|nr:MAG: TIGR02646 family protein [Candidatus Kentron sp. TUN]VFK61469.1 MAG: TIGR02646 family protein [Candidatus Kentron sp. TUN]VFK65952.1 MAG: TIGR02646 family protein [Candidatus Kentron sp. TUN]